MCDRLIGTEVEYGIYIEGVEPSGLDVESARLVEAWPGKAAHRWDYSAEAPRRDLRGFEVDRLTRDPEDAKLDASGAGRRCDGTTIADRILANGARLYNDHAHPEYSTPECSTLRELIAHEKAGERIVLACARIRAQALGRDVVLYKNNTDFSGMSYGAHENYLVPRSLDAGRLQAGLIPFLVTRQIFAGAGKVGVERHASGHGAYQISQRADFVDVVASVDTLSRRPIFNTREEPHADPALYRRLHVIIGDANMSEISLALKVGTTRLVLSAIEQGLCPDLELSDPVRAVREVSWDVELSRRLPLRGRPEATALDIQRRYADAAGRLDLSDSEEGRWILEEWIGVLDTLQGDFAALHDRLDWVAKLVMLDGFIAAEGIRWQDDTVRSLDLAYHDIDPESGLYYGLLTEGAIQAVVSEEEILAAAATPPSGSRAALRALIVDRYRSEGMWARWGRMGFEDSGQHWVAPMEHLVGNGVERVLRAARSAIGPAELITALSEGGETDDETAS